MTRLRAMLAITVVGAFFTMASAAVWGQSAVPFEQLVSQLQWRSIGPSVGGRVVAVSGVAQDPNTFYMGAVGGGIWKSYDYGVTWENISDKTLHSSSISIGAIAVAPSDPNVIYAGTGEADFRNDVITGDGMFKSTDAGKTWQAIGLADTHMIGDIVVNPDSPDVVYVAALGHGWNAFVPNTQGGVYKTSNGGQSWQRVLSINDGKTGAIDLAMDPQNPDVVYAAMWQVTRTAWKLTSGGSGSGLYKTTDGGAHWTNISHNPGMPAGIQARIGVAVSPSNPGIVYAVVQAKHGGLFRSKDAGQHWERVNNSWDLRQRGFYYSTVYVDPKDPDTVYLPEVSSFWVSHDGGKTLAKLHTPHGDNHVAWINPNNPDIIEEGNDGGATVSTNGGKTWTSEDDQPTGEFYHVDIDNEFPFHVYGAQQDEGSTNGPSSMAGGGIPLSAWQRVAGGEGNWVVPQPGEPWITYASGAGGLYETFFRGNTRTEQNDEISPWPHYHDTGDALMMKYRFAWTHPTLFAPGNPNELLVGVQCVLETLDRGNTWKCISPDLTHNDKSTLGPSGGPVMLDQTGAEIYAYLSGLAVSPLDDNVIWAGSSAGLVHVTTDGGAHWTNVTLPQFRTNEKSKWGLVSSISPSYVNKGAAYLTISRYMWDDFAPYVYKTTDYGQHWTKITQGLPNDQYVMGSCIDPGNQNLVFVTTRSSVYVSLDAGDNWQPLSLNLPHTQVRNCAVQAQQNSVVVATHGRGFWALDNLGLLEDLANGTQVAMGTAHVFKPQVTWMTTSYGASRFGGSSPSVGKNHPFGAMVFFHLPSNYDGTTPATLEFTTASGQVVNTYKLHLRKAGEKSDVHGASVQPGMNEFLWDLNYHSGAEAVNGFYAPRSADSGYSPKRPGPQVVPGTYQVSLNYGGQSQQVPLVIKLDPRLTTTSSGMEARQKLQFELQDTLDQMAKALNPALALQADLEKKIKSGASNARYQSALSGLNQAIGVLIQMHFHHADEGDTPIEPALYAGVAGLYMNLGRGYLAPREADYAVYSSLNSQVQAGIAKLEAAERDAHAALK